MATFLIIKGSIYLFNITLLNLNVQNQTYIPSSSESQIHLYFRFYLETCAIQMEKGNPPMLGKRDKPENEPNLNEKIKLADTFHDLNK